MFLRIKETQLIQLQTETDLSGFPTASFTNKNEGLIIIELFQKLVFMQPNRQCFSLVQYLVVSFCVGPAITPVNR